MDAVIKVGGSLAENPAELRALCNMISELAKKYELIVVPGGGRFADVVRDFDLRFALPKAMSHRMAILAMDQYGLLLSNFIPNSCKIYTLEEAEQRSQGKVQVFLPSQFMLKEDPLENSWDVTSDSIAAYVASRLGAAKVLLVTDVDGIFTEDPKKHADAKLIRILSAAQLLALGRRTSVDRFLPKLLLKADVICYVVNGNHPERVEAILAGQHTTGTVVTSGSE
jgi:aspartokinase-like uncharacterized kinase